MNEHDKLAALQAENASLIALLESRGIERRLPPEPAPSAREPEPSRISFAEKVALFRRLFRGRTDVYPSRRESKSSGKSGYAPACANEWRAGVCEKPRHLFGGRVFLEADQRAGDTTARQRHRFNECRTELFRKGA